jgi:tRNA (guanine26-N2/guanine27-N2)-dimethyltransferase
MEVEGVTHVLLSDINFHAFELAQHNIALNGLQDKIVLEHKDANRVLSSNASPKKRFDIVDIDPFGTPVPYLDSAIRALKNGGLLAATATDLAPLCGVHTKACIRKYGGKPMRTEYCHELAVRLLSGCIAQMAAKHDIGVKILLSHSSDHYIRVYAQISYGCQKADESLKNTGYILHCFNCLHRETTQQAFHSLICPECGAKMDHAGPLWIGPINNEEYINQVFAESQAVVFRNNRRINKFLVTLKTEAEAPITYYVLDQVGKKLGLPATSMQSFILALHQGGYQVVQTHFNPRGIKTNASTAVVRETFKKLINPQ